MFYEEENREEEEEKKKKKGEGDRRAINDWVQSNRKKQQSLI